MCSISQKDHVHPLGSELEKIINENLVMKTFLTVFVLLSVFSLNTFANYPYIRFEGHTGKVDSVTLSSDGKTIASGSWDDSIRLWDIDTYTNVKTFTQDTGDVWSVAFSPDGKTSAAGLYDNSIALWDIDTARQIGFLSDYEQRMNTVDSISFNSNGKTIVSGNWDMKVRLWNITRCFKITPYPIVSPAIGEKFTINIEADIGPNVFDGYFLLFFNENAIRYVETTDGDLVYGSDTIETDFFLTRTQDIVRFKSRYGPGRGTLAKVTFEVIDVKESDIKFFDIGYIVTPYLTYDGKVIPPQLPSSAVVSVTPSSVLSPAVGEQLIFNIDITNGQNVASSELTLDFDPSALKHISSNEGSYFSNGIGNGNGILETITFEVLNVKTSTVGVSGYLSASNGLRYIPTFERAEVIEPLLGDVNRDGVVSILDLVTVAGAMSDEAAAPAAWSRDPKVAFKTEQVQKWLSQAQYLRHVGCDIAKRHSLFRKSVSSFNPEGNDTPTELSKSI